MINRLKRSTCFQKKLAKINWTLTAETDNLPSLADASTATATNNVDDGNFLAGLGVALEMPAFCGHSANCKEESKRLKTMKP